MNTKGGGNLREASVEQVTCTALHSMLVEKNGLERGRLEL